MATMLSGKCIMHIFILIFAILNIVGGQKPPNDAKYTDRRRNYQPRRTSKFRGQESPFKEPVDISGPPIPREMESNVYSTQPMGSTAIPHSREESQPDLVEMYTQNFVAKLAVAGAAAVASMGLSYFTVGMIMSSVPMWAPLAASAAFFLGSFFPGDFGALSRALGVLTLVLLRRAKLISYVSTISHQLAAASGLGKGRRAFPPGSNPWRYKAMSEEDPPFNMYTALFTMILVGALLGNAIAKPIPLFPAWIGSLSAGVTFGYITTIRDARGDLLRFIGGSLVGSMGTVAGAAGEVKLLEKAGAVGGRSSRFLTRVDHKYHVMSKVRMGVQSATSAAQSMLGRIRSDIDEPDPRPGYQQQPPQQRW